MRKFKSLIIFSVMALVLVAWVSTSMAQGPRFRVMAIKEKNTKAYNQVLTGFSVDTSADVLAFDLRDNVKNSEVILKEIKLKRPDLILVIGLKPLLAIREQIKGIPIIYTLIPNQRKYNLEQENVTGISMEIPFRRKVVAIEELLRNGRIKLGVPYNPKKSGDLIKMAKKDAAREGATLYANKVDSPRDVINALRAFVGIVEAIVLIDDTKVINKESTNKIIKFTNEQKLPLVAYNESFVKQGALLSLSPDYTKIGQQAGRLADKILMGDSPMMHPVEAPEDLAIALNLTTAQELGVADRQNLAINIFIYAAVNSFSIRPYITQVEPKVAGKVETEF